MPGLVNNVLFGEISIPTSTLTSSVAISSVISSNCILFYNNYRSAATGGYAPEFTPYLTMTNSSVIATIGVACSSATVVGSYTILECTPGYITKNQGGLITLSSGVSNSSVTLASAVDVTRAFPIFQGHTYSVAGTGECEFAPALTYTSSTVTLSSGVAISSGTVTGAYQVVEMISSVLKSVQSIIAKIIVSTTSITSSITAVTSSNTLCIYNGQVLTAGTQFTNSYAYGFLATGSSFTATRNRNSASVATWLYTTIVEFNSSSVKSRQAGQTVITSSNTSLISSITTIGATAICNWIGLTNSNFESTATGFATCNFSSVSSIIQTRGSSNADRVTTSWEVFEPVVGATLTIDKPDRLENLSIMSLGIIEQFEFTESIRDDNPPVRCEFLTSLQKDFREPEEWKVQQIRDYPARDEFSGSIPTANNLLLPLEIQSKIADDSANIDDFLGSISDDSLIRNEFIGTINDDSRLPLESMYYTLLTMDDLLPFEILYSIQDDSISPNENISLSNSDKLTRSEIIALASIDSKPYHEFLAQIFDDSIARLEFINRPQTDANANLEFKGSNSADRNALHEFISAQTTDRVLPQESLIKSSDDVLIRSEFVGTISLQSDEVLPFESVGGISKDARLPLEATAAYISQSDVKLPLESTGAVSGDRILQDEIKTSLSDDTRLVLETLTNLAQDQKAIVENYAQLRRDMVLAHDIVSNIVGDRRLPLEAITISNLVSADKVLSYEFIGSSFRDNPIRIEFTKPNIAIGAVILGNAIFQKLNISDSALFNITISDREL